MTQDGIDGQAPNAKPTLMRTKIDWRSASKENYNNFCKKHPSYKSTFDEWRNCLIHLQ